VDTGHRHPPEENAAGVHRKDRQNAAQVRIRHCLSGDPIVSPQPKDPKDPKTRRKPASKAPQPKSRTRRVTKAAQRAEMMEQILDTAEELFSKHGLYGVTLKDVAKRVGVHHTLMNYYFRDKKKLFDAVFARRATVTSERRMKALDDYEAEAGDKITVEGALHAFLDT